MELDGELVDVTPGSTDLIKPGCRQWAIGRMKSIKVPVSAFDLKDCGSIRKRISSRESLFALNNLFFSGTLRTGTRAFIDNLWAKSFRHLFLDATVYFASKGL